MEPKKEFSIQYFPTQKEFLAWMKQHHDREDGVWLQMFKKATGKPTINHGDALDVALCFGWIDGQSKSYDSESWIQKFTPRRKRSLWSKINIANVERLIKSGQMTEAGLREIEAAKADGRWHAAYDAPSTMEMPDDFLQELAKRPKAKAFFDTLNKSNTYAIGWRLQTAKKSETRAKRMQVILDMLERGEKFH